ncbi:MAG: helix-turn-helix transcriptional regulator [Mariniphaga sp.]|nr:helix-turn-helix transcriptional regulator [Mariniphaga sp.]
MINYYDSEYLNIIYLLIEKRKRSGISIKQLADKMGCDEFYISSIELFKRRLDIIHFCDWIRFLGFSINIFQDEKEVSLTSSFPLDHIYPISAESTETGIFLTMNYQNGNTRVLTHIAGCPLPKC